MIVIAIILLSLIGTIIMITLCGGALWSFIYLIRYRLLRMNVKQERYAPSRKKDTIAIIIAILTLAVVAVLLIFGLPFVLEHISEFPAPFGLPLKQ